MTSPIDITEVVSWPQAIVAIVIVVAILVVPQVVGLVQNMGIKKQFRNNGGSTMKDAVDRIESMLTEHIEQAEQGDAYRDARISALEDER